MAGAWMVRAGRKGYLFDEFKDQSFVALGWKDADPNGHADKDIIWGKIRQAYPDLTDQSVSVAASQLYRFVNQIEIGDKVVTYDLRSRAYLCGIIEDKSEYFPDAEREELLNRRRVTWTHEKARDELSDPARNTLGAILTLFVIPHRFTDELWSKLTLTSSPSEAIPKEVTPFLDPTIDQVSELAAEKIKDRIARLDWSAMQDLVAGLIRAMGYKTIISPPGSDRGKDIVASPDGFGFQPPRIVVEVKHRPRERMGAQEIRAFIGGRKGHESGLYVSTGGFTREAYYEAERATISLTLLDFKELVAAVLSNYHNFDERTRQILPLTKIHWPL